MGIHTFCNGEYIIIIQNLFFLEFSYRFLEVIWFYSNFVVSSSFFTKYNQFNFIILLTMDKM